jgi:lipopolysaccharide export system protein LptA
MNPRTLRRALLGLVAVVIVAVAWTLRRPAPRPSPVLEASPVPRSAKEETRTTGLVFRSFNKEDQKWVLEAESNVGSEDKGFRLKGVKFTFEYTKRGQQGTSVITSDEGAYDPKVLRAVFEGHVVLKTDDGFEFKTNSLVYRGDKGLAKTEGHAEFKRKDVSGTCTGTLYSAADERFECSADVRVQIQDESQPPTEIRSRQVFIQRAEGTMRFEEDAHVTQGADTLRADRLILSFDPETQAVLRAVAAGGVDLRTAGGRVLPGLSPAAGKGARRLKARKLDIALRPDRSIEQIIAQSDVDLVLMPGPGEVRERRRVLAGGHLILDCDEKGRVVAVRGQKDASLSAEPLDKRGLARTVKCRRFEAQVDPEKGSIATADFFEEVEFSRGRQRASANQGHYDGEASLLTLEGGPAVEDERGTLSARTIRIGTESGDVNAETEVSHTLQAAEDRQGLLGERDTPSLLTCRSFASVATTKTATCTGGALLRSGKDEVRGGTIVIQTDAAGRRKLDASPAVVSFLNPRPDEGKEPPPAVEGRADAMEYDEAKGSVVYTGNAVIRQGEIETRSPRAAFKLTSDGTRIETMVAGEPVEVRMGDRRATGTKATYTPGDQTMVLVGDEAVLQDPKQQSRGRSLTFHVGDDRVLVDGREQGRTETIFQNEPRRP